MRRRGVRYRAQLAGFSALLILCLATDAFGAPPALSLPSGPLVQVVDTNLQPDHADISVQFSCSARYITNTPANFGSNTRIRLRLGPDCGSLLNIVPAEFPQVGGGGDLVTGARLESVVPGEVVLELTWSRDVDFVLAPTANGQGLRVRLYNLVKRKGSGTVYEPEAPQPFIINLESSLQKIDHDTVEQAAAEFGTQAYVSEIDIEDEHWSRLRIGPFSNRSEAERVLKIALAKYPRAWLAVSDEQADLEPVERAGVQTVRNSATADPPLADDERARILRDARAVLEKHQYPEAIDLLTRLLRQPEYAGRSDAQELMGLVHERAGQLALAKSDYEDYVARYPNGAGADRIRRRLAALLTASLNPKTVGEGTASQAGRWSLVGSAALGYQYDKAQTNSGGVTTSTTAANAALVYGDLLVRERGTRFDFTGRVDGGYTHNLITTAGGSQDRTTAAFVELDDRSWGLSGRLGRQTLVNQGTLGLFDGLAVGYQINPQISVSVAGGYPAYTSYSSFSSKQQFETVSAEYSPWLSLVFDGYLFNETFDGTTDRRSFGFQSRFSRPGYTAILLLDYDIYFANLNSVTLIGNMKVGDYWIIGLNADHRHSPLLETYNALIGQTATDLRSLQLLLSPAQIKELATARTAQSDTFVISANRPIGERWQFMADISALRLGGTSATAGFPAPGGGIPVIAVPATPSSGVDKNATIQLAGNNLLQSNDLHIFGVRFDDSPQSRSTTLSWDARFALPGAWRIGPRFSVEQIKDASAGGKQFLYLPEIRSDWTSRRQIFEIITGYQVQTQQELLQLQNQTGQTQTATSDQRNLYLSATYRLRF
jgi:SPOR domain